METNEKDNRNDDVFKRLHLGGFCELETLVVASLLQRGHSGHGPCLCKPEGFRCGLNTLAGISFLIQKAFTKRWNRQDVSGWTQPSHAPMVKSPFRPQIA